MSPKTEADSAMCAEVEVELQVWGDARSSSASQHWHHSRPHLTGCGDCWCPSAVNVMCYVIAGRNVMFYSAAAFQSVIPSRRLWLCAINATRRCNVRDSLRNREKYFAETFCRRGIMSVAHFRIQCTLSPSNAYFIVFTNINRLLLIFDL